MASVGASAAQGLQAGWQMGMQADEAELRRQTTEDSIRQRDREFGLREKQYADQQSKIQTADEYTLLGDEHKQLLAERAAMEAAGQAPTSEFNQRVIQNRSAYRAQVLQELQRGHPHDAEGSGCRGAGCTTRAAGP